MAFCESCGTQMADGAAFCPQCGKAAGQAGATGTSSPPAPALPASYGSGKVQMKKVAANVLIALFVLLIVSASSQAGKTHIKAGGPGDVAGALGELTGYLLLFVGMFYSARWRMKLSGHNYKVG